MNDVKVFYEKNYPNSYEPDKTILQIFGTNRDADEYNEKCFNEINAKIFCYKSTDTLYQYDFEDDDKFKTITLNDDEIEKLSIYDKKCVEQFNMDCKAPENLVLKEGCRVMLLQNLDLAKGLVNGSCGTIKGLASTSIYVDFDNGQSLNIEPFEFEYHKEGKPKVIRKQFPLRLAYGITIHKSQGMTFDKLVVNFSKIFDYGQAYVALSRTRTLDGLIIKNFNPHKIVANKKVIKFYKELENNPKCIVVK